MSSSTGPYLPPMKGIEQLLRQRIGLDAGTLGPSVLERIVRLRTHALKLDHVDDYRALLATSSAEWEMFVESVVVAETWFFRDRQPFLELARLAHVPSLPSPLRLLSVPCASGEEPYSMVMALLDAGLPPERFRVDAMDISSHALALARRASYGRNSFRGDNLDFRERHFRAVKDRYVLNAAVRERVRFVRGNILEAGTLAGAAPYDFIFCRNLLIYFDHAAQRRALNQLGRWLSERGYLFVGPAEMPLAVKHGFVSANLPMAFACRKASPVRSLPTTAARCSPAPSTTAAKLRARPAIPAPAHRATAEEPDTLRLARRLADAGQLQEAALMCHKHLQRQKDSAEAYYVLGLLADAQGLASAAEFYRKALYLDPHHCEALQQMALLCAKQGDHDRARVFSRRAERAQKHDWLA